METAAPTSPPPASEPIICRIAPWYYYRRMGPLAALFLIFGGMFLYDGIWGYPKKVELARKKEQFMKQFLPSFEAAKKEGRLEQWMEDARAKGMPTGVDGDVPRWATYAAQNGWEEDPKLYSDREIAEQFYYAYGCFAGAAVVGIVVLLNRRKMLRAEADHWVTPEGVTIRYADVCRVDKRKWEHQALAYVWHRTEGGREKRAVIDDLKFDGAGRVLDRLMSRFSGELIEKVSETESAESVSPETEK
ncbi:hypothetical protein [Prosthecobacter sp.]|uniref:hypothetical protein n=1 Tax=Prosthecobacter sp. TaxID=1965333 RepID=UPI003783983C